MGVVNVTPDSFSDGGRYLDADAAIAHGRALVAAGATIVDVGGESTRPGAEPVDAAEELRRVIPVVLALAADARAAVSIDTTKATVAAAALEAGAQIVNDVSGGLSDPDLFARRRRRGRGVRRDAHTRHATHHARRSELRRCRARGRRRVTGASRRGDRGRHRRSARCSPIPASGSRRRPRTTSRCSRALPELAARVGVPLLVGTSRKSFLAPILADDADSELARDDATLAMTVWCFQHGVAVVRVHDVEGSHRAVALLDVLERATAEGVAA